MSMLTVGREVGRLAAVVGLAIAMSGCKVVLEDPPRAMYGTTAWSDAWQVTCSDVDPSGTKPQKLGAEHLDNDCHQYEVAQHMRNQEPRVASSQSH
jgi:hypothetical protein